jgi:hypothetical protein
MLLATISLLNPAVGRLIGRLDVSLSGFIFLIFAVTDVSVIAAVIYDLSSRRHVHPALAWDGSALMLFQPLVLLAITNTSLALRVADSLR